LAAAAVAPAAVAAAPAWVAAEAVREWPVAAAALGQP
jgi:hypothetical protein